jgi:PhzF family phenazine biosynthesis protein
MTGMPSPMVRHLVLARGNLGHNQRMLRFSQVDVFTDKLLSGNPVAVVHDSDQLTSGQMEAMARWTNLSETTFLLAPTDPAADYRLRIFTPRRELSFAAHPTLGSARAWLEAGGVARRGDRLVQQCGAGLVPLRRIEQRLAFAAPPLLRSGPVGDGDLEQIAGALRLQVRDIVDSQWTDNGPGWVAVLLHDAAAVLALEPDREAMGEFNVGVVGPYPKGSDADFEVRAFTPKVGGGEDPVTGSLNGAVAQWLIGIGQAPTAYTASQGTRLQRRGRVHIEQSGDNVWVGGDTVVGISGTVAL